MREHEVPTHVQAEDRVLLGFTFPQVVAVTAVCAISYGAYRYAPVGPSEVRMAIAVLLGLVGVAMTVGKIGGRRLPLVAADLLKYRLGARRYAGPVSQLVRAEERPRPPEPDGETRRARAGKAAQEQEDHCLANWDGPLNCRFARRRLAYPKPPLSKWASTTYLQPFLCRGQPTFGCCRSRMNALANSMRPKLCAEDGRSDNSPARSARSSTSARPSRRTRPPC